MCSSRGAIDPGPDVGQLPVVETAPQTVTAADELVHADGEVMRGFVVVIPVTAIAQRVDARHIDLRESAVAGAISAGIGLAEARLAMLKPWELL